jgi:hypothetical protein
VRFTFSIAGSITLFAVLGASQPVHAQSDPPVIDLVVSAGRPLRVALDERVSLKRVGQVVTGRVVEPVYAYDRIVIPVGTKVRGHVAGIDSGSTLLRARAYLGGNFSPPKHAVLQFDTLQLDDGSDRPIGTVAVSGVPNVKRQVAGGEKSEGKEAVDTNEETASAVPPAGAHSEFRRLANFAMSSARQQINDTLSSVKSIKQPRQMNRLKDTAIQQLPYHPQYLAQGTTYEAELTSSVVFGTVVPAERAPAGTGPAPDSILTARLATTLDSSKTPRGTQFEAILIKPVFSADHRVILPEGTKLTGEVTLATPARHLHRNGQLRFLFERVQVPEEASAPLLGALHAVEASADDRVVLDDEGGATLSNSKTRFIAPTLALLALHASIERDGHEYADPDGDGTMKTAGSGVGARGVGGFIGFGFLGAAMGSIARPVGIAFSVYGAVRTTYTNILGKGREVVFPANTPIEVRLAPGPSH